MLAAASPLVGACIAQSAFLFLLVPQLVTLLGRDGDTGDLAIRALWRAVDRSALRTFED